MKQKVIVPLVASTFWGLTTLSLVDNLRGPLYKQFLETFALTEKTGPLLFALNAAAAMAINIFSSKWKAYLGLLNAYAVGLFCITLSQIILFASSYLPLPYSSWFFFLAAIVLGIGMGMGFICMNAIASYSVSSKIAPRILAGLHSVYALSSLFAPLLVGYIVYELNHPWTRLILTVGLFPATGGLYILFLPKSYKIFFAEREQKFLEIPYTKLKKKQYDSHTLLLILIFACFVVTEIIFGARIVYFLETESLFSPAASNAILSSFFASMFLSRIFFSFFSFSIPLFSLVFASALGILFSFLLGLWVHPYFFPLMGFFIGPFFPLGVSWISKLYPQKLVSLLAEIGIGITLFNITFNYSMGPLSLFIGNFWGMHLPVLLMSIGIVALLSCPKKWKEY